MREKPKLSRFYLNFKTGQYCHLEGSPLAIRNIETKQWKRQKVRVKRISGREFWVNAPKAILGVALKFGIDKGKKRPIYKFHDASMAYYPH